LSAIKTASSEALREVRAVLGVLRTEDEAAPRQPALGINRLADLTADAGLPVTTTVTGEPRELPPEVDRAVYRIVQEALTNVRKHAAGPDASATIAVDYLPTALHLAIRNRHGADEGGPAPETAAGEPAPPETALQKAALQKAALQIAAPVKAALQKADLQKADLQKADLQKADLAKAAGDEPGPAEAVASEGTGIAGMRERAQSLGGSLEAGPVDGGYLVSVLIPTESVLIPTEKEQS
jgi:signal transduction histidine kinase